VVADDDTAGSAQPERLGDCQRRHLVDRRRQRLLTGERKAHDPLEVPSPAAYGLDRPVMARDQRPRRALRADGHERVDVAVAVEREVGNQGARRRPARDEPRRVGRAVDGAGSEALTPERSQCHERLTLARVSHDDIDVRVRHVGEPNPR
jgi:hypothetical protein